MLDDFDDQPSANDPYKERLRQVAEKIQVGDSDEGADALGEIVQTAVEQAHSRRRSTDDVQQALKQLVREQENEKALGAFKKKYPTIAGDEDLTNTTVAVLEREIADDLRKAGVPEEQLAKVKGNTMALVQAHNAARMGGLALRDAEQILDATGKTLQQKYHLRPAQRSPQEYVRDLRIQRGLPVREDLPEPARTADYGRAAPRSDEETRARNEAHIQRVREARGFGSRQYR